MRPRASPDTIVEETYTRARHLCEKLGQSQQLLLVLFGEYLYCVLRGEVELSLGVAEELLRTAQNQGDTGAEYLAHRIFLGSLVVLGAFTEARSHGEQALDLYKPMYR